ncbi:hypothetical protein ACRAWD_10470 [Caulobacter segnis]
MGDLTQVYSGNAELKPYSAGNWTCRSSTISARTPIFNVAVFGKRIKDQITTVGRPGQDIGVTGHLFNISRPINGDHAEVKGVEAGPQHFPRQRPGRSRPVHRATGPRVMSATKSGRSKASPRRSTRLGVPYDHGPISPRPFGRPDRGPSPRPPTSLGAGYNVKRPIRSPG